MKLQTSGSGMSSQQKRNGASSSKAYVLDKRLIPRMRECLLAGFTDAVDMAEELRSLYPEYRRKPMNAFRKQVRLLLLSFVCVSPLSTHPHRRSSPNSSSRTTTLVFFSRVHATTHARQHNAPGERNMMTKQMTSLKRYRTHSFAGRYSMLTNEAFV
jgi:hypothetical protein